MRTLKKSAGQEAEELSLRRIEKTRSSGKSSMWLTLTVRFFSNLGFLLRCVIWNDKMVGGERRWEDLILLLVNVNLGSGEKDGREGGKKKMCVTFIHRNTLVIIKIKLFIYFFWRQGLVPSWLFLSRYFFFGFNVYRKIRIKGWVCN